MLPEYEAFLAAKAPRVQPRGFEPREMLPHMTGHYKAATEICVRRGRCAAFLDTGLGKTSVELEFIRQCTLETGYPGLIFAPLAVTAQIKREADKFGYDTQVIQNTSDLTATIGLCNYDRMEAIDPNAFRSVALDESSILKSFSGATSRALIARHQDVPFRLPATATPAPNDHMELGQHSEFLGIMSSSEMLARWFKNDTNTASQKWRLKGHAERDFWDWMASWAVMAETPEDLGFDGSEFVLPELKIVPHKVEAEIKAADGSLLAADMSATSMHGAKRQTAQARAEKVAALIDANPSEQWLIWCDSDYEADALMAAITGAKEVRGSMPAAKKEDLLNGFQLGTVPYLITKPSIAGWGMNFQNCHNMVFVGRTFSYESWYQAVRRCWRFGQKLIVWAHLIVAEGENQIGRIITRKSNDHQIMRKAMRDAQRRNNGLIYESRSPYQPNFIMEMPAWIR